MKLSVKDAARLFNISEKTVYRWIQGEHLPHYRVGGQYRFSYFELLEEHRPPYRTQWDAFCSIAE